MPSTVDIRNNLPASLALATTVHPHLSGSDWGVDSSSAASGETTQILWMNREEGIHDGDTWVFTTGLGCEGVEIRLQERLTGTLLGSTLELRIDAGDRSTGWQANTTSLAFTGADGNGYRIDGAFVSGDVFDDVAYTVAPTILPQIEHVVVLMLENRSLDNLLGWLYAEEDNRPPNNVPAQSPTTYDGLVASTYGNRLTPSSPIVYASEGAQSTVVPSPDPGEEFSHMTAQIFGTSQTADMSGFLADYATIDPADPDQIMQSYSPAQLPVISEIARAFAVSDAWYASVPCQTWPNRGFVHTGSSDGHVNNDDYEPYDIDTIFDLLEDQGLTWMVYNDGVAPPLAQVMFPKLWDELDHFGDMESFYVLCQQPATAPASDKLPQYTFLEPNFLDSDESYHPPHDVTPAEQFLAQVYGALQACPYRDEILFVITFDEHGGCYDHVPPPSGAVAPEPGPVSRYGGFDFDRYGVRVPTIVVSSYVQPGTVFRAAGDTPYDHTSILATLRDWLGIDRATFTATLPSPRIGVAPTLAPVLTETEPQAWPVVTAPELAVEDVLDLTAPPDELVMSVVAGEASRLAGRYIGPEGVAALRREIRTIQHARAYFAAPKPNRRPAPIELSPRL